MIEQLAVIPDFVTACGFANVLACGLRRTTIRRRRSPQRKKSAAAPRWSPAATATLSSLPRKRTTILYPVRGGGVERIGPAQVRERYGVEPAQVPDFIALRGDPSDGFPGAPGVGAAGAAALLRQYGSLAALLKAGRFAKQAENLWLYRAIATMDKKAPLPNVARQKPTWEKAAALAKKWRLMQLAARLEETTRLK